MFVGALMVVAFFALVVYDARVDARRQAKAEATGPRFYMTDAAHVGQYQKAYLLHDDHASRCLLVVETIYDAYSVATTSQPWPC
jgi:hypothetical protein